MIGVGTIAFNDRKKPFSKSAFEKHRCDSGGKIFIGIKDVDHKKTYKSEAEPYENLVAREDYRFTLFPALEEITPFMGRDILDLGSGTGRVAMLAAPHVNHVTALDLSHSMLSIARDKLQNSRFRNWSTAVADHRGLPVCTNYADIIVSGWSVCYLVDWYRAIWKNELNTAFHEMKRVLKPTGEIILIETMGTGFERPTPPPHLLEYYAYLKELGFSHKWIRTDYKFNDLEEAKELTGFFFGEALKKQVSEKKWVILPAYGGSQIVNYPFEIMSRV
jgi:ubiquinone/menaquinone biosynthesis C-methylase UbiE